MLLVVMKHVYKLLNLLDFPLKDNSRDFYLIYRSGRRAWIGMVSTCQGRYEIVSAAYYFNNELRFVCVNIVHNQTSAIGRQ